MIDRFLALVGEGGYSVRSQVLERFSIFRKATYVMTVPLLTLTHMEKGVRFFHRNDELLFLEWWSRIPCVESCDGDGSSRGLVVQLKRRPGKDDLRQLLALCRRSRVDMRHLAAFETAQDRDWFRNPKSYWYHAVFGKVQR